MSQDNSSAEVKAPPGRPDPTPLQIVTDDPGIEAPLRVMEKHIWDAGGYIDPDIRLESKNGSLSVYSDSKKRDHDHVILLPHECLVPFDGVDVVVKDNQFVVEKKPDDYSARESELLDAMVEVYNRTNKIQIQKDDCPWITIAKEPELLDKILKARTFNEKFKFYKNLIDEGNEEKLLVSSFFHSRFLGHKHPETKKPRRVLMPIVDYLNHSYMGSGFNSKTDQTKTYNYIAIQNKRPILSSSECYAYYNILDALDTYLLYNFIDTEVPFVRSVPLDINIPSIGNIRVGSRSGVVFRNKLSKKVADLRRYIPMIVKRDDDKKEYHVTHLIIPTDPTRPHALRRVLILILRNIKKDISDSDMKNIVLAIEKMVVVRNIEFYENLCKEIKAFKTDKVSQAAMDTIYRLADVQRIKLLKYVFATK